MLLLNINKKPYMGSPIAASHLTLNDLERSNSKSLRFSMVGDLYGIDIFSSSSIATLTWMSQRAVCGRAGFSAVTAVLLVATVNGQKRPNEIAKIINLIFFLQFFKLFWKRPALGLFMNLGVNLV